MIELAAALMVGIGTYFSRSGLIVALAGRRLPDTVLVVLQFVAPAVLSALVVALLIDGEGNVAIGVPEAVAFAVGAGVAYRTRNHIYTLVIGMGVFWIVRAIL